MDVKTLIAIGNDVTPLKVGFSDESVVVVITAALLCDQKLQPVVNRTQPTQLLFDTFFVVKFNIFFDC